MVTEKSALRTLLLAARRGMAPAARAAADDRLLAAVTKHLVTVRGKSFAGYVPMNTEPGASGGSTGEGAASLRELLGVTAIFPLVMPDGDLDWARGDVAPSPRGLWEPTGPRLGVHAIATVDLVIAPALAVDVSGMRLGRGGGAYDRALGRVPAGVPIVALVFDDELLPRVPAEPHDRP
ncbi:MAG: 5-formyltetrahydrofolate cyclo-ligase, partial [Longispora sp.]|nr:5-formyltetrahydrofolate cyclo-ligase [Longispora sp. (in: high G+C Gram-positive bacteria)]